jgi:hypothetical protein
MINRITSLAIAASCTLIAQSNPAKISLGLTGGIPIAQSDRPDDESRRYTFGPRVDFSLTEHIQVTVNPLYKRLGRSFDLGLFPSGTDLSGVQGPIYTSFRMRAHSLELPVIGNYYFGDPDRKWRPFAGAGFALRTAWMETATRAFVRDTPGSSLEPRVFETSGRTSIRTGVVFAGGVAFRYGRFTFVPEFRYTFWGAPDVVIPRHQADALFSIRF